MTLPTEVTVKNLIKETIEENDDYLIVKIDPEMCADLLKAFYDKLEVVI